MGGGVATTTTSTGSGAPAQSGMDVSGASVIGDGQPFRGGNAAVIEGVKVTHMLPDRIQKGQEGGLEIDDKNVVVGGEMRTTNEIMRSGTAGLEKSLIIDQLQTSTDTVLVWIEMPASGRRSILGKALSAAEQLLPPTLVDTQGERYQPVGYMYKDETEYRLRFTPGDPITAMMERCACSSALSQRPPIMSTSGHPRKGPVKKEAAAAASMFCAKRARFGTSVPTRHASPIRSALKAAKPLNQPQSEKKTSSPVAARPSFIAPYSATAAVKSGDAAQLSSLSRRTPQDTHVAASCASWPLAPGRPSQVVVPRSVYAPSARPRAFTWSASALTPEGKPAASATSAPLASRPETMPSSRPNHE
jgi:hypothetical protein